MQYQDFLAAKAPAVPPTGLAAVPELSPALFPFQRDLVAWALRRGRAAIFADTGLGKTRMQVEWARVMAEHTGGRVLILASLAVAAQTVREAEQMGVRVTLCRDGSDVADGVNITNYDRLHLFDAGAFSAVVLDESSCLKDFASKTRNALIQAFGRTPYRLVCSATPAPNDHVELGNHSEFLGIRSRVEMLATYFCHDGGDTQSWRLKGHARRDFWAWVCSWAAIVKAPSVLGYSDAGYVLPAMHMRDHVVACDLSHARASGLLFVEEARSLDDQRKYRRATIADRVAKVVELVQREPSEPWLIWCELNDEGDAVTSALESLGAVQVRGSDDPSDKESKLQAFSEGRAPIMVTKPSIAGMGLNWQHCARVVFLGISHSFEQWYRAIRRVYRFGQKREIECHVVLSEADDAVVANLKRKHADAETMSAETRDIVAEFVRGEVASAARQFTDYRAAVPMRIPAWLQAGGNIQ